MLDLKNNRPWIEKYRPTSLDDVMSQEYNKSLLKKFVAQKKIPHLLLFGSSGTGKTSAIFACIQELKRKGYYVSKLELNASDNRGINIVRKKIKEFAGTYTLFNNGLKLIILDEADSMTIVAQFALRRIIEKYSDNVRFCIICNYINKIIPALQSRCIKLRFGILNNVHIKKKISDICDKEHLNISRKSLDIITKMSNGDMRRAINILQSISIYYNNSNNIKRKNIRSCLGYATLSKLNKIYDILINIEYDQHIKYMKIKKIIDNEGILFGELIKFINKNFINNKKDIQKKNLINILIKLASLEHIFTLNNVNPYIHLGNLISTVDNNIDKFM